MSNAAIVNRKNVYVPAAAKPRPAARVVLPRELVSARAGDAFRSVAWAGAAAAPEPLGPIGPAKPAPELARQSARSVFAAVPWTGESPPEPTRAQAARSVNTVLAAFKWE